jgi:hypothetical protein
MKKAAILWFGSGLLACSSTGSGTGTTASPKDAGAETSVRTGGQTGYGGAIATTGGQAGTSVSAGGTGGIQGGHISNQGGTTGSGGQVAGCIPGASALCYCPNAQQGAQTCTSSGTFDACVCSTADAASTDDSEGTTPVSTGGTTGAPPSTGGMQGTGGRIVGTGGTPGTGGATVRPDASVPQDAPCGGLNQTCCQSLFLQTGNPCTAAWTACFDPDGTVGTLGTCVACGGQNQKACWVDNLAAGAMTYTCQAGLVQTYNATGAAICTVLDAGTPKPDLAPDLAPPTPDTLPPSTCGGNLQYACFGACQAGLLPLYCSNYSYSLGTPYATLCEECRLKQPPGTVEIAGTFCVNCPAADLGADGQCAPRSYLCGAVNELPCP